MSAAAVSQVRRAVRTALRAETGEPPLWRWSGQVPAQDFVAAVLRHRVAGLVAGAEALEVPPEVHEQLASAARLDRMDAMAHLRAVAEVAGVLDGIDHLVVKGAPLAVQTTGDPTARGAADVDVLVDTADLPVALGRLAARDLGVRREHAVDRDSWMWRYQRWAAHEVTLDGPLGSVDLHWRLDPTHDGLPGFAELWSRRTKVDVGPVTVATLGVADAFAHALRHAAQDDWGSLRSLVDVHRLARDPAAWRGPKGLARLDRTSLTVVDATVGLPDGTPAFRRTSSGLARAVSAQRRPVRFTRFPGDAAMRAAGYTLAASRSPRDVALTVARIALPPLRVTHLTDRGPVSAIARALLARSRRSPGWDEHR
nr:nucleotidyltransferase family protein [Nocardioides thalensis]